MTEKERKLLSAALVLLLPVLQACAGVRLVSQPADPAGVRGVYSLYLYGCRYPDDIENAAFLIARDAAYPFELYTLESSYTIKQGLTAREALAEADRFLRCGMHSVWYARLRRIPDDANRTFGYEIVPVYVPYDVGTDDVLLITYALRDGKVRAVIRPTPRMERDLWRSENEARGRD